METSAPSSLATVGLRAARAAPDAAPARGQANRQFRIAALEGTGVIGELTDALARELTAA